MRGGYIKFNNNKKKHTHRAQGRTVEVERVSPLLRLIRNFVTSIVEAPFGRTYDASEWHRMARMAEGWIERLYAL